MIPIKYNVRSLMVRKTTTIATALGIALVVFVLSAAFMLSAGVQKTLGAAGREDNAVIMRKGSGSEMESTIEQAQMSLLSALPGIKKDNGKPVMVGEIVMVLAMEKVGAPGFTNVMVRGVGPEGMPFRPNMRIVEGVPARPGTDEVVIGKRIKGRFKGVDLGSKFELRKNRPVVVVGVFEDAGSSYESEVWADLDTMRAAFGRQGAVSAVRVRLESPGQFDGLQAAVEQDKRLGFQAVRETRYYEKLSEGTSQFISAVGTSVAFCFAIGAMIGAMITMYAAVANRQKEIGTLRALGFSRAAILFSFIVEAVLLAMVGGIVGTVASLAMGAVKVSMVNFQSWSEIVFGFEPTPDIMIRSLVFAGVMGFIGGFAPALRAARVSPITAMRGG